MRHFLTLVSLVNGLSIAAWAAAGAPDLKVDPRPGLTRQSAALMADYLDILGKQPEAAKDVVAQEAALVKAVSQAMATSGRDGVLRGDELLGNESVLKVISEFNTEQLHLLALHVGQREILVNSELYAQRYISTGRFHTFGCTNWNAPLGALAKWGFAAGKEKTAIRDANLKFVDYFGNATNPQLADAILYSISKRLDEENEIAELVLLYVDPDHKAARDSRKEGIDWMIGKNPLVLFPTPSYGYWAF